MKSVADNLKRKTRIFDVGLIIIGLVLLLCGIFTWLSFNSVSETFLSSVEKQGYSIPASISSRFRQITLMYLLVTISEVYLSLSEQSMKPLFSLR